MQLLFNTLLSSPKLPGPIQHYHTRLNRLVATRAATPAVVRCTHSSPTQTISVGCWMRAPGLRAKSTFASAALLAPHRIQLHQYLRLPHRARHRDLRIRAEDCGGATLGRNVSAMEPLTRISTAWEATSTYECTTRAGIQSKLSIFGVASSGQAVQMRSPVNSIGSTSTV